MGARPRCRGIGAPAAHSHHSGARRNPGPAPYSMRGRSDTGPRAGSEAAGRRRSGLPVIPTRSGGISWRAPSASAGGQPQVRAIPAGEPPLRGGTDRDSESPRPGSNRRSGLFVERHPPAPALAARGRNQLRPGNVSSATPDLSSSPFPIETISSYCAFVARASGKLRPASCASPSAMPESFAACDDEK